YQTVQAFAADVQRCLAHQPIAARPPSKTYRFQKFVYRHKLGFIVSCATTGALVLALGVSSWLWRGAEKARKRQKQAEGQQARLLHPTAVEEQQEESRIRNSLRASTLARVRSNWLLNAQDGKMPQAIGDLETVVQMDPDYAQGWWTLAAFLAHSHEVP